MVLERLNFKQNGQVDSKTQIWFRGCSGEDLNVIFYQNMPNLNNWYKFAERKISKKKQLRCY
jgi:hypothetical protein